MTVYDRIDEVLKVKKLSRRKLARMAGIPETTLASAFSRKPEHFPSKYIKAIAAVLEVPAVYLATGWEGLKDAKDRKTVSELLHVGTNDMGNGAIAEVYPDGTREDYIFLGDQERIRRKAVHDAKKAFEAEKKKQLLSAFDQLNDEGQAEAIKQVELIAKIPDYRKSNEASS